MHVDKHMLAHVSGWHQNLFVSKFKQIIIFLWHIKKKLTFWILLLWSIYPTYISGICASRFKNSERYLRQKSSTLKCWGNLVTSAKQCLIFKFQAGEFNPVSLYKFCCKPDSAKLVQSCIKQFPFLVLKYTVPFHTYNSITCLTDKILISESACLCGV